MLYRYRSEAAFPLSPAARQGLSGNSLFLSSRLETTLSRKESAKDDGLLSLVRAGDKLATERFIRLNAPWMLAVARRYVKDDGLAEDCVQESLLNALRSLDKFEERSGIKTWLHPIVVNACLMKLRPSLRASEEPIDHLLPQFDANDGRIEAPWSQIATPDEVLEQQEMRVLVRAKIAELPNSYPYRFVAS